MDNELFIYISPGCDANVQKADIQAERTVYFRGVSSYDEAEKLAKEYKTRVSSIQLCGGFGIEGTARVIGATDNQLPVGAAKHDMDPIFNNHLGGDEVYGSFRVQSMTSLPVEIIPGEKIKVGFIVMTGKSASSMQRANIHSAGLIAEIRGVCSYEQAEEAARELLECGCVMLEMDSKFDYQGEYRVKMSAGPGVPCGTVRIVNR